MKFKLFIFTLSLLLGFSLKVFAQQAVVPCVPTTSNTTPCTPISTTVPFPTSIQ